MIYLYPIPTDKFAKLGLEMLNLGKDTEAFKDPATSIGQLVY